MEYCLNCNILDYFCFFGYVLDFMEWLLKQCFYMCKVLRLINCSFKGNSNSNIFIQLNLFIVNRNIYFFISKYEFVRCFDCYDINSIVINCNIDSLFDIKGKYIFIYKYNCFDKYNKCCFKINNRMQLIKVMKDVFIYKKNVFFRMQ